LELSSAHRLGLQLPRSRDAIAGAPGMYGLFSGPQRTGCFCLSTEVVDQLLVFHAMAASINPHGLSVNDRRLFAAQNGNARHRAGFTVNTCGQSVLGRRHDRFCR
jgi:hypothetical protein